MRKAFDLFEETPVASGEALKIGEVSKRSGVGIEALRFYEKSGLLDRPARTHSGYRVYNGNTLNRLAFIKKAQMLGFTLDEIKELIDHKRKGENPCAEVRSIARERLADLNERIKRLTKYRNELRRALEEWETVGEAEGHVCGLIENSAITHGVNKKDIQK